MSKTQVTPLRLFTATEVMTGQPKAVLKVTMTAPLNDYDRHQFGFSFFWHGRPKKRNRAYDVAKFALEPDAKVKAALDSWIYQQNIFVSHENIFFSFKRLMDGEIATVVQSHTYSTRKHQNLCGLRSSFALKTFSLSLYIYIHIAFSCTYNTLIH